MTLILFRHSLNVVLFRTCRNYSKIEKNNLNKLLFGMPREGKHIAEQQEQRLRIKEKSLKYTPGTVNLQILGSGAPGTPSCVYMFTDQSRYLFNCGEGTQRLAHEHKTKLARLEHVFITRTSWDHIGGLPGLSLTIQDSGVPSLTLHGPPGLDEIFKAMRRFVILRDLKVNATECTQGGSYEDSVMTVNYVPLTRHKSSLEQDIESNMDIDNDTILEDTTDYYAHENKRVKVESPSHVNMMKSKTDEVMAYICKLKPKPGMLNLEKCVEKGVPPGPLLGQLKNGINVTLEDGTVIKAEDVRGPDDPGPIFIFIDVPNEDYLKSLEESMPIFSPYQATAISDLNVALVVIHFTPNHIFQRPEYRNFIEKFSPSTQHIALNENNKFSGYVSAHRIQWQLNQLNDHIFPLLGETINDLNRDESKNGQHSDTNDPLFGIANPITAMTCFHLRPRKGIDRSLELLINPDEYVKETQIIPGFTESLEELHRKLNRNVSENCEWRKKEFPKINFLGTGSCIPNKTRNVSAILMHTSENSCILLDCGEGTTGQIIRLFGVEKSEEIFRNLKAVYISHLHADHHIGLIGILKMRRKILQGNKDPILLLAPEQISSWLKFYDLCIESINSDFNLIPIGSLIDQPLKNERIEAMGIDSISTCLVRHCPHAFGVALNLIKTEANADRNGLIKITYSGDTMPSSELVEIGKNSTILIHEATMEDELDYEAKLKMHSTISQAIEQGRLMDAEFTILTHFSQRYAKLPRIKNSLDKNIGIAFDNMEVTLTDLKNISFLYPSLKLMFTEHCEEMEQKALKRAYKKQRLNNSRSTSPVL